MTRNNHLIGFVATIVFLFFAGWFNYRNYLLKQPIQEEPATLPQPEVCNTISPYDHLFKQYADSIKWDWQLLAAIAYKESKFDTSVVSWAGAKGLMQLMPRTARAMGVPEGMEQNAEESIKGAVRYLTELERSFRRIPDPDERKNFILASYNAGIGHILDAMALADKYGHDKYRWKDNLRTFMLNHLFPDRFTGFQNLHAPAAYRKQTFEEVWAAEPDLLRSTCTDRFRTAANVNQWVCLWWQIAGGGFVPGIVDNLVDSVTASKVELLCEVIEGQKHDMICLNDPDEASDVTALAERLRAAFEAILPEKSQFELV